MTRPERIGVREWVESEQRAGVLEQLPEYEIAGDRPGVSGVHTKGCV